MKKTITIFVITFLSTSLVAQTQKWQEMEQFKNKIDADNYLTKENVAEQFNEAKQIHANGVANATGNDLDMINSCYAFSLTTLSDFYSTNSKELESDDFKKERLNCITYLEEVAKRAPIKFEKNGKKLLYSKSTLDKNLGLLYYYIALKEKSTANIIKYIDKAIASVSPYKKDTSSNYLTFKYEKFRQVYYVEDDYSEEGINAALEYLIQYYELKSEKETNFLLAKGFIFDYLSIAFDEYYEPEIVQKVVKLPNELVEDKIGLLYDINLMTPNKIQTARELLKLYYGANTDVQKKKKLEARYAAN